MTPPGPSAGAVEAGREKTPEERIAGLESALEFYRKERKTFQTQLDARAAEVWEEAAKIAERPIGDGTTVNTREIWRNEMGRDVARLFRLRAGAIPTTGGPTGQRRESDGRLQGD